MTRTSRLASSVLAISLAILPAAAFAQQTTAPAQPTAPDSQVKAPAVAPETQATKAPATQTETAKTPASAVHANAAQPADSKAPAHGAKTEPHAKEALGSKEAKPTHAKLGTTTHTAPAPAKTGEPDKS